MIINNDKHRFRTRTLLTVLCSLLTVFSSCLGLNMDIHLRRNGSGRITIQYRIPAVLENTGRLDGNQNWPIIPIGRRDWERSISRTRGLSLASYSSSRDKNDYITNIIIDFDNTDALSAFLNTPVNGNKINLILTGGNTVINDDIIELIGRNSDYRVTLSFTMDGETSSLQVIDANGNIISAPNSAQAVQSGRKVSFAIDTQEIYRQTAGLGVRVSW